MVRRFVGSILVAAAGIGAALAAPAAKPIVLPFVENDYPAALTRARDAKLPLFVEVWAPW